MRKLARRILAVTILSLITTILLTRCGVPLCIGGAGDCGWDPKKNNQNLQGTLKVSASTPNIAVGQTDQIVARGGTAAYTYSIFSPDPTSPLAGWVNSGTGLYTAPTSLGGYQAQNVIIKAVDVNGNWGQTQIQVQLGR